MKNGKTVCSLRVIYVAWPKSKELSWKILWKSVKAFGCNCERDGKISNGSLCLAEWSTWNRYFNSPWLYCRSKLYIKSNNLTKTNSLNNYNARFKDLFAEQHRLLFLEKNIKMSWSYDILRFNNWNKPDSLSKFKSDLN